MIYGDFAFNDAKRKARYGHRNWIVWTASDGVVCADRVSESSVRQAMESGSRWTLITANDATPMVGSPSLGTNLINNLKWGIN